MSNSNAQRQVNLSQEAESDGCATMPTVAAGVAGTSRQPRPREYQDEQDVGTRQCDADDFETVPEPPVLGADEDLEDLMESFPGDRQQEKTKLETLFKGMNNACKTWCENARKITVEYRALVGTLTQLQRYHRADRESRLWAAILWSLGGMVASAGAGALIMALGYIMEPAFWALLYAAGLTIGLATFLVAFRPRRTVPPPSIVQYGTRLKLFRNAIKAHRRDMNKMSRQMRSSAGAIKRQLKQLVRKSERTVNGRKTHAPVLVNTQAEAAQYLHKMSALAGQVLVSLDSDSQLDHAISELGEVDATSPAASVNFVITDALGNRTAYSATGLGSARRHICSQASDLEMACDTVREELAKLISQAQESSSNGASSQPAEAVPQPHQAGTIDEPVVQQLLTHIDGAILQVQNYRDNCVAVLGSFESLDKALRQQYLSLKKQNRWV